MYITLLYLHHSAETMVVFPSLEKTLETPWTARRSNQSILKEISPRCSLERLMVKLKLQYTLAT